MAKVPLIPEKDGKPSEADFGVPWYLFIFVLLPFGIPLLTLGGAIPGGIGGGFAAGCFTVARKKNWTISARTLTCLGLVLTAYAVFGVF